MHASHDHVGLGQLNRVGCQRNTEVAQFHRSVVLDQNVLGFDIPVNDPVFMRRHDAGYQLAHDVDGFFFRQSASLSHQILQGASLDVFHDDEVFPVILPDIVDFHDIRMGQLGRRVGFSLEPHQRRIVLGEISAQNFYRDFTFQNGIDGEIDRSHAAFSD